MFVVQTREIYSILNVSFAFSPPHPLQLFIAAKLIAKIAKMLSEGGENLLQGNPFRVASEMLCEL